MAQEKRSGLAKSRLTPASDSAPPVVIPQRTGMWKAHGLLAAMSFRRSEGGCDAVGVRLISEVRPPGV
jgi:hypothetical protein